MILDPDPVAIDTCNPVLQACAPATRAALERASQRTPFDADTVLVADGDPGGQVILPIRGTLQMGKATSRGRRQVICHPEPESCGGICLLEFGETALAEARGVGEGEVLILSRAAFEEIIRSDPVLCRAAWESAASCMAHLSRLVAQLSFNKVSERVIQKLLGNTQKDGETMHLTQTDLAAEVGTTREVVARCLGGLQADDLIRIGRGRVTVLSRTGLEAQL